MNAIDTLIADHGNSSLYGSTDSGPSLGEMASGGFNHAQQWSNPNQTYPGQSPVMRPGLTGIASAMSEADLPPGSEGTYAGGPLANPKPTATPTPPTQSIDMDLLKRFSWSTAFDTSNQ